MSNPSDVLKDVADVVNINMKLKSLSLVLAVSTAVGVTGCVSPNGEANNTGTGALVGTLAGAGMGAAASRGNPAGALIGAAAGAIVGGIAGNIADQRQAAELQRQAPATYERVQQGQPLSVSDVTELTKSGISDDVIISQIRSSGTVFHLSSADIIYLHNSNVSEKVIDYMINTPSTVVASAQPAAPVYDAPPAPPAETVVVAPGPGYVWIPGDWVWRGRWVWAGGRWAYPPRHGAIWVGGYWGRGPHGYYRVRGYWR
jgi:uncharacterized protein YcfJ